MEITLDQLCLEQKAVVTRIETSQHLRMRLRDFGMIPGTKVRCRCFSPNGFAVALEVRGSVLALRSRDLRGIWGVLADA
jgi:ferrous iron transport protein A